MDVPEANLEQTDTGQVPAGAGWFVLNARDARWRSRPGRQSVSFTGPDEWTADTLFPMLGVNLAVLEPGPQHGYAVIESLRSGSEGALDLPTGTVYPALHRLERAGLIASDWQTVGGRRRRAYHLTPAGQIALGEQRALWDQFSTAVTALLKSRTWPATA